MYVVIINRRSIKDFFKKVLLKPFIFKSISGISNYFLLLNYKIKFFQRYPVELLESLDVSDNNIDEYKYSDRYKLYEYILNAEDLTRTQIDYLEFGVFKGDSLKWWIEKNKNPRSDFFGFDTFTGLPENWDKMPAGTFSTQGNFPEILDLRCTFIPGLFQKTLHTFLLSRKFNRRTIIHMDADIYSSTLFVLTTLGPYLKKGDILIFDEFRSVLHEFKAFIEFKLAYGFDFKLIGVVNKGQQIAFIVK